MTWVTFSFGGVPAVCHLERRTGVENPRAYPRHHGLTFLRMEDFDRLKAHLVKLGMKFLQRPALRFANTAHEHQTMMLADLSGNVVGSATCARSAATKLPSVHPDLGGLDDVGPLGELLFHHLAR